MKRALCVAATLFFAACAVKKLSTEPGNPKWGLDVMWHGHSCFTLTDSTDRTIVIDPFDETVGYGRLKLFSDAVLVTHNHFDHNFRQGVKPRLRDLDQMQSTGTTTVAGGVQVTGVHSDHDEEGGEINGPNNIYLFVMGGLRCVHLGDLGTPVLTDFQKKMIGKVDVLFIPVGGVTTLDAEEAKHVVDELKPSIVFPMHYGNLRFFRFDPVEKFTALFQPGQVRKLSDTHVRLHETDLTDTPVVYILNPTTKNY
jgi:L-ascorbate metabolism protein UlaG (beta-lactamase superfamily)